MFGFLNIRKPAGPSSFDVVARVRRRLPRRTKIGHTGTLDPFADGVLVMALGHATRLTDLLHRQPKQYRAEITLGASSPTDDPEGQIVLHPDLPPPSQDLLREALQRFEGTILQTPPAHSAARVDGRRAYALARAGQAVDLRPREVTLHALRLVDYAFPRAIVEVTCSTGTYIRSLARDLGQACGTRGYCSALTRTHVGPFSLGGAMDSDADDPAVHLISPLEILGDIQRIAVGHEQARALILGRRLHLDPPRTPGEAVAIDPDGRLAGLCEVVSEGHVLQPRKMFPVEDD